ncbi:uncharacterized protein KIAA0232 homolog isoform X2 [Echinops telfairi]|uniref:Uncharacterized protein KIAA0232 homolog isoform X2 n=1 Tax=Echinops telfairi TaxID=9371 RepID=A0AC55D0X5_ECHTE|nr:uncharacterized protein KIAA0232 homolog isoform X2 [Echinops telfairi]
MSLLRALGPVQTWLGQELEKCGIDALVYSRYVLSLLLHDSCDYDLQEQENDIFLGWEKGAYRKWGKSKKCSDLTLEEMKKQAAVRCLRSASDESSGIETLVEELCSRLKDLQSEQEEKTHKKSDGSPSPEAELSPTAKDQVEMYYEAFPPLSKKPVYLQEIMTVWNKSQVCSYSSSSSSTAPPASTDTSSPKDGHSEGEPAWERGRGPLSSSKEAAPVQSHSEKGSERSRGPPPQEPSPYRKQARPRPEGKARPRSWSSGSSEAGSSSSGTQGEPRAPARGVRARHRAREVRNKKGRGGQSRILAKGSQKTERGIRTGSSSSSSGGGSKQLFRRGGRRPPREPARREAGGPDGKEVCVESRSAREYKEEPLWYTEPLAEYFTPSSRRSKLETTYRRRPEPCPRGLDAATGGELVDTVHGLCVSSPHKTYLSAGTFIDGHFVEMPADITSEAAGLPGTPFCSPREDAHYLDDIHLSEFTHFYEVDIDQSMLDPGASEATQGESRILNMIRQKDAERTDLEADCCIVLDEVEWQGERAIWTEPANAGGTEGLHLRGCPEDLAVFWGCCSSSSGDAESFGGDSPVQLSPLSDSTLLSSHALAGNQELFPEVSDGPALRSCFSVFEVQCGDSGLPFSFETLSLGSEHTDSSAPVLGKTQSRLLIWTKNSAFDENDHCSSLSTRTCSPWSHSEETRSDNEALSSILCEEPAPFSTEDVCYGVPRVPSNYVDEELLDFLQDETYQQTSRSLGELPALVFKKKSKLESVCGIPLEEKPQSRDGGPTQGCGGGSPPGDRYHSGVMKGIWTHVADGSPAGGMDGEPFPADVSGYCSCLEARAKADGRQEPSRAVQRSEYRLWDGQKGGLQKHAFAPSVPAEVDGGDYTTPSRPWEEAQERGSTFILGGVYGELQTFSEGEWAVVPPSPSRGSLLQCAASDVVTIAGTDVFMTPGNSFAPGHRQLWRPLVSFEQREPPRSGEGGWNKGFSFIFHEDLLGACGNLQVEEPGLQYPFSSLDLGSPLSQVLHVECSFEPDGIAPFSPSFKPKAILCSESDGEVFHPRTGGAGRTQYRAIRISPRTHFRPISASELSPGAGSESESEKEEAHLPIPPQVEAFQDPQADLKPLEEDAETEGHYYGKSELESGKFLPRLKKSGMEKSAQTSLDSQEEVAGGLPVGKRTPCLGCSGHETLQTETGCREPTQGQGDASPFCGCRAGCPFPVCEDRLVSSGQLAEKGKEQQGEQGETPQRTPAASLHLLFPVLDTDVQDTRRPQENPSWWEKALFSPLFPTSECDAPGQAPGLPPALPSGSPQAPVHVEYTVGPGSAWSEWLSLIAAPGRRPGILRPLCHGFKKPPKWRPRLPCKYYPHDKGEDGPGEFQDIKDVPSSEHPLDFNRVSSVYEARCTGERLSGAQAHGFRRKS